MKEKEQDIKLTVEAPVDVQEVPADVQEVPADATGNPADAPDESADAGEMSTLQKIILEQAVEEDAPVNRGALSLRKILGGDILMGRAVRNQIGVMCLVTLFILIYIAQRYSCQKLGIEIDKLQTELKDAQYKALSTESELTEKTRQSRILNLLEQNNDSLLKMSDQPPYLIQIPEGEDE